MSAFTLQDYVSVIEHSLGFPRAAAPYRNRYCAETGDPLLNEMVDLGMMARGSVINEGRDSYFCVTEAGRPPARGSLSPRVVHPGQRGPRERDPRDRRRSR